MQKNKTKEKMSVNNGVAEKKHLNSGNHKQKISKS